MPSAAACARLSVEGTDFQKFFWAFSRPHPQNMNLTRAISNADVRVIFRWCHVRFISWACQAFCASLEWVWGPLRSWAKSLSQLRAEGAFNLFVLSGELEQERKASSNDFLFDCSLVVTSSFPSLGKPGIKRWSNNHLVAREFSPRGFGCSVLIPSIRPLQTMKPGRFRCCAQLSCFIQCVFGLFVCQMIFFFFFFCAWKIKLNISWCCRALVFLQIAVFVAIVLHGQGPRMRVFWPDLVHKLSRNNPRSFLRPMACQFHGWVLEGNEGASESIKGWKTMKNQLWKILGQLHGQAPRIEALHRTEFVWPRPMHEGVLKACVKAWPWQANLQQRLELLPVQTPQAICLRNCHMYQFKGRVAWAICTETG